MKFLKTYKLFENNQYFKVGDFVKIIGDYDYFDNTYISFFKSNFGQITDINDSDYPYEITFFKNISLDEDSNIFYADLDELEKPNDFLLDNYLKELVQTNYLDDDEYNEILINIKSKKYNL